MPIFHITTEGDCEGRTTADLGYVEADNPEQAVKHLHLIGKKAYYSYRVKEVKGEIILKAKPDQETFFLKAEPCGSSSDASYWQVETDYERLAAKHQEIELRLAEAGLTKEDLEMYLKGK